MNCDLNVRDCITIENAIFKFGAYVLNTKASIDDNIDDLSDKLVKNVVVNKR